MTSRNNRSSQHLSPRAAAEAHLRGFQTREPRDLVEKKVPWPTDFFKMGVVEATLYHSDKDDPLTRPPHLRRNDPDGRQGVWKLFRHEHGADVGLYTGGMLPGADGLGISKRTFQFTEPPLVWWMAELDHLICSHGGHKFEVYPKRPTELWGTPNVSSIILLPKDRRGIKPHEIGIIRGGRMTITPMGIEY
jgi:hypothetical protein